MIRDWLNWNQKISRGKLMKEKSSSSKKINNIKHLGRLRAGTNYNIKNARGAIHYKPYRY